MLLGDKISNIRQSRESVGMILVTSKRSWNEVASNLVHLLSVEPSLFTSSCSGKSIDVLSLLSVNFCLSLSFGFCDELEKGFDLFLHDLLSNMIVLRFMILSQRLIVLYGSGKVATGICVGLGQFVMEGQEVSFRATLGSVLIFISCMSFLK